MERCSGLVKEGYLKEGYRRGIALNLPIYKDEIENKKEFEQIRKKRNFFSLFTFFVSNIIMIFFCFCMFDLKPKMIFILFFILFVVPLLNIKRLYVSKNCQIYGKKGNVETVYRLGRFFYITVICEDTKERFNSVKVASRYAKYVQKDAEIFIFSYDRKYVYGIPMHMEKYYTHIISE